jgi:hypothetical protein
MDSVISEEIAGNSLNPTELIPTQPLKKDLIEFHYVRSLDSREIQRKRSHKIIFLTKFHMDASSIVK